MKTWLTVICVIAVNVKINALTIVREYLEGDAPTNSVGGGSLTNNFDLACKVWELAIQDDFELTLRYGWSPVGAGQHTLNMQGGNPNRETTGTILFNNDNIPGHAAWFIDPNPLQLEGLQYVEAETGIDRVINGSRYYHWNFSGGEVDLFTAALHEIGHALGMSFGNTTFNTESVDGDIDITSGEFRGMTVPLQTNVFGVVSHVTYISERILMSGSYAAGERVLPSVLDLVILAELSKFEKVNFKLLPLLEIKSILSEQGNVIRLSWIQPLPVDAGKKIKVETCLELNGPWQTVDEEIVFDHGVYSLTIPNPGNQSFFRLTAQ